MSKQASAKAKAFLKEYSLSNVTQADLRRIIKAQGYTIVEFNHIYNDEAVAALIEALGLEDMVASAKGFTYADRQRRLVFLHEDLSEKEKLLVLAHEEGHIYCDHLSTAPIMGADVVQEHEANEFTHYILKQGIAGRFGGFVKKHKVICAVAAAVLVVALVGALVWRAVETERSYYGEYYITETGSKYHEEKCIFVKNKTNTRRMTVEEYESGDYAPCGTCLPHTGVGGGGE